MTPEYAAFLAGKAPRAQAIGIEPSPVNPALKPHQRHAVEFALRQGRAALFHDTGLGKTLDELEFAHQATRETGKPALILTPLAVARQTEREAAKFGYNARVIRDASETFSGTNICNYDRLDKLDVSRFGAIILDESSILKSFTGATTRALIQAFQGVRFKLACTATPAPNDHMELGQHAEFLEIMASNEMLARWFISDQTEMGRYRIKAHGEDAFWDWMASWSHMIERPSDIGLPDDGYILPPLNVIRHSVAGDTRRPLDGLFARDVSATNMHDIKRQTAEDRAAMVASLVAAEPDHAWVVWCDTDYEADALRKVMPYATEVRGLQPIEKKEAGLADFAEGRSRVIITKASIAGFGCNWQHADRQAFVGRSFSYEAWYQAVRRSWRFGQTNPVNVHIAVAEGEDQIGRVIDRKAGDHAAMKAAMKAAMARNHGRKSTVKVPYNPTHIGRIPSWLTSAA